MNATDERPSAAPIEQATREAPERAVAPRQADRDETATPPAAEERSEARDEEAD